MTEDWDTLYRCFSPDQLYDMTTPKRRNAMGSSTATRQGTVAYRKSRKPAGWICVLGASLHPGNIWPTMRPIGESTDEEITSSRYRNHVRSCTNFSSFLTSATSPRRRSCGTTSRASREALKSSGTWKRGGISARTWGEKLCDDPNWERGNKSARAGEKQLENDSAGGGAGRHRVSDNAICTVSAPILPLSLLSYKYTLPSFSAYFRDGR